MSLSLPVPYRERQKLKTGAPKSSLPLKSFFNVPLTLKKNHFFVQVPTSNSNQGVTGLESKRIISDDCLETPTAGI